jgi:S1-C subfamily serine protease
MMYDLGWGVTEDRQEAARWYRLAANQGLAEAQAALGRKYHGGWGVPEDFVQAHLWHNLAAAQGDTIAEGLRDSIARRMTPAQIAEAQRLAREWRPRQQGPEGNAAARELPAPPHPSERPIKPKSSGSGFVVSVSGHLLTNQHVVESCARLTVQAVGRERAASLIRADTRNDLALLKMQDKASAQAHFREGRGIRSGDSVVVLGYPLSGLLASEANVTTGTVSALSGPGDDSRLMQITAPVQPGSSGGPILDSSGNIVGIVVSKLDALKVAAAIGDIPQNVNFGIHASVARTFLDANGVDYQTAPAERRFDPATIAAQAKAYTVLIECW